MSAIRIVLASFLAVIATQSVVSAADWEVYTPPMLSNGIKVGNYRNQTPGSTILLQKGQVITLSAAVTDVDRKLKPGSMTDYDYKNDDGMVEWTKTGGGSLTPTRTASGTPTTYTAPNAVGEFTITATPDDKPTLADDNLNTMGAQTITVKVIDACPDSASVGAGCTAVPDWTKWKTHGYLLAQATVTGGTPPAPATTWDGLVVKYVRTAKSKSCMDTDFDKPFDCASSESQTVGNSWTGKYNGNAANMVFQCTATNASNAFNIDVDASDATTLALKAGKGPCEVQCDEEFFCDAKSLGKTVVKLTFTLDGANCKVAITR